MVQESTMICIDNSEWMRNGDLSPTRLQCQQEAANLVLQCKLRSNPENAVGLLSMADTVRVLSTMTSEDRKLFCKLHEVDVEGTAKIVSAIKVAHLALKHRQNRNHKMRIVLFIGSPIEDIDNSEFIKLAKKLKKEKVNVDIVCFGEATGENNQLVADFVDTLNGKDGTSSNMVVVSSGSKLTEALLTSAVCRGEDGAPQVTAGAGGGFEFGIDAEEDPELALALRVSLEEQRQRQRQETTGAGGSEAMEVDSAPPPASGTPAPQQQQQEPATAGAGGAAAAAEDVDLATMTEEEQIQWALRMSMMQDEEAEQKAKAETSTGDKPEAMETDAEGSKQTDLGQLVENPELLKQLVDNLPGGGKENEKEKEKTDDKESTSK